MRECAAMPRPVSVWALREMLCFGTPGALVGGEDLCWRLLWGCDPVNDGRQSFGEPGSQGVEHLGPSLPYDFTALLVTGSFGSQLVGPSCSRCHRDVGLFPAHVSQPLVGIGLF